MSARDIFKGETSWTTYAATLQVRDKVIGGIPLDPDTIKKWLTQRLELGDRELEELVDLTLVELGVTLETPAEERLSTEEVMTVVAAKYAGGNGFKNYEGQLCYEGRCMKAALKEAANVAYPGTAFPGKPAGVKKGLMRYMAERVFVDEQYIPLGVTEASGREQRIKHIMTAQGPRSAINVVDYVDKPLLEVTVRVLDDCLKQEVWARIWEAAEEIGIGADRARSDGKFDLLEWKRIT